MFYGKVIYHIAVLVSSLNPDEETLKVTDFSISREQTAVMTQTMGIGLGTPHWKPPEVIKGEQFVARSDVYSYGIVMWEIFTRYVLLLFCKVGFLLVNLREMPYSDMHYGHQIEAAVLEGKRPRFPALKATAEPLMSVQKEYCKLAEYCLHGDTPVTLASGFSMKIKDLVALPEVRSILLLLLLY